MPVPSSSVVSPLDVSELPTLLSESGAAGRFAFEEFLHGQIRNPHTRKAYLHAVRSFSRWCEQRVLELTRVAPADVGRYLDAMPVAAPTRKLHLAALRRFFDALVLRHVVILNPALSVRGERYQVVEGKTPEISIADARRLLHSIDTRHAVGLRDRAIIGILIYTAARVGAVARLRRGDFYRTSDQFCLRFHEKGGKVRAIPVRHDLQKSLHVYLEVNRRFDVESSSPLFTSAGRRTKRLTSRGMTAESRGVEGQTDPKRATRLHLLPLHQVQQEWTSAYSSQRGGSRSSSACVLRPGSDRR